MSNLRQEFADKMLAVGASDPRLVVMVGDISHGILKPFAAEYPDRYYNVGICEPTIVGMAAGVASTGLIPVAHTIAPFLIERSFEQIKLDFAYQQLAGNFITVGGAFDYAQLGCSHHCYNDVSLMCQLDNTVVTSPASAYEFSTLFSQCYDQGSINYFKLTENPHSFDLTGKIELGKAVIIEQGSDITLIAVGPQLKQASRACATLKAQGHSVELLYIHTIKPFDAETVIQSISKTKAVIVCEELSQHGGVYDLVMRHWASRDKAQFKQMAINNMIHDYGTYDELCQVAGLTDDNIVMHANTLIENKKV
ncbi:MULTISPECIES: transketolase family protein [Pseudoalteromonas]|uniref:Transketolase-like pyrimidine-binding domain-containing protein n=1 Tax=Pseudoalteromonas piscicida TaxID=43662 RepID=A0AAD0W3Q2_PSEO7|nr:MULTISPECIES: transketolase C-terminal domain-containing protein [Pseudoalteromonas]ASD67491.1 hypothetical protein B1L02_11000 [Pseudoalteromonas piscicida]AXR01807.1 hypothetical protein D0511_06750 [Pseudoalteromonas piscicida]MCO7190041.1 hypothetical protein [Pseudoalteromonas sp. XMcav2-N]